ncbi:MAG TPA: hypothetical protein VLR94_06475, partial [Acidobacteriota bacterium]|nr:hypothetical protein [Acidobacteriota bacterium]
KLQSKLREQSRQRMIDALEYHVTSRIIEEGFEKFGVSQKIEDIAQRRIDPHSAVHDLLKHFKMES